MTDRASSEVLDELENKIRAHYFPNSDYILSDSCRLKADLKNCLLYGSSESIKFLVQICFDHLEFDHEILAVAFRSGNLEGLLYLVHSFWDRMDLSLRLSALNHAARCVPLESFKSLLSRLTIAKIGVSVSSSLFENAILGGQFWTLEFLREIFSTILIRYLEYYPGVDVNLIVTALKSNLPEANIRDYIELVGSNVMSYCHLGPATANGHLKLIKDYNLCRVSDKGKADAIGYAAKQNRELTSTLMYVIDRYTPLKGDFYFLQLIQKLTEYCTRDILQYLIKHIFGNEISAELKAEIIAFLVISFKKESCETSEPLTHPRILIPQFCIMMLWTRPQINYTGKPSKLSEDLFCVNSNIWNNHRNLIQECLDSVSY